MKYSCHVFMMYLAEGGGERDDRDEIASTDAKSSSAESIHMPQQPSIGSNTGQPNTPVQPRTASIRSRPTSSRITAAELEVTISHPLAARAPDMLPLSFFRPITESIRGARCPRIEWHCRMHETRSRLQLRPLISLPGTISAAAG